VETCSSISLLTHILLSSPSLIVLSLIFRSSFVRLQLADKGVTVYDRELVLTGLIQQQVSFIFPLLPLFVERRANRTNLADSTRLVFVLGFEA